MELVFIFGLVALGLWSWAQTQRIEALSLKIDELERRLAQRAGEELPPLLLDQPLPEDDEPLLLDTPVPQASNDDAIQAHAPVAAQMLGLGLLLAAFLAPAIAAWPAQTLYLCAVGGAAIGVAALKRWPWLALAALIGLHVWFAVSIAVGEITRALALIGVASLGAALLSLALPLRGDAWRYVRALAPGAAVSIGAVLLVWTWVAAASGATEFLNGPAIMSALHVVLAAYLVRGRAAAPAALAVAIIGLLAGVILYRSVSAGIAPPAADFYPTVLICALTIILCGLGARPHRGGEVLIAASASASAALLMLIAAFSRIEWHSLGAWGALLAGAAALFAAASQTAADVAEPRTNTLVAAWAAAGAALAIIAVESIFPATVRSAGHGFAALLFAAALSWRRWRVLGLAAVAGAGIAIVHALAPLLGEAAAAGPRDYLALGAAATVLFAASAVAPRDAEARVIHDALSSAALVVILVALLLALSRVGLAPFHEAAARAVILITAGHVLASFHSEGGLAAWRGHALIGAGLIYALATIGAELNPWWGAVPTLISGAPVFNSISLAYLTPAALGFAAAWRFYERQLVPARVYAGVSAALMLIWLVLELRRAFHGAAMSVGAIGPVEAASYALLALTIACVAAFGARAMKNETALLSDLRAVVRPAAWTAVLFAAFVLLVVRHAWWGVHDGEMTDDTAALVATLAQVAACGLALALGRALSVQRGADPTRFAAAALAAVCAWSFGHAGIRWLHLRGGMDDGAALAGVEGVAHALWPLAFVSVAAWATARAPGRDTIRAYLFDLQALWAAAIWPGLAFAALGLWVLFNPWWGALPGDVTSPMAAAFMLAACLIASALSAGAPKVPHVRWSERLTQAAAIAWTGHLFVAVTLAVRWLHHGERMREAPIIAAEMWMLTAGWAVLATALWFTRPQRKPGLSGAGFLTVTPGARRERRYGRRQRS